MIIFVSMVLIFVSRINFVSSTRGHGAGDFAYIFIRKKFMDGFKLYPDSFKLH